MRYAVIKSGKVANTILLDNPEDYACEDLLIQSDTAGIGDTWNGTNFIASPPPKSLPDWSNFNSAILNNAAYNRVAGLSTNQRAVSRLETIAVTLGSAPDDKDANYLVIAGFWNAMLNEIAVVSKPTTAEIAQWSAIASTAFMPFTFDTNGKMIL